MLESTLITEVLSRIASTHDVDAQITKLALSINQYLSITERNNFIHTFWRQNSIEEKAVFEIAEEGVKVLTKKSSVMSEEELANQIKLNLGEKAKSYSNGLIINSLTVDKRFKKVKDGFGLMTWRQINPKSIRDKAYIILKKTEKPMHFAEIATEITKTHFDNKHVTVQAVHNELIRYDQFVLVGRGLYALKEWGYSKGTVAEVIETLLRKKSPLSKQEIISGVLKQRQVKKGTISLNLQKNPQFVRVGRAMYSLEEVKSA